MTTKLPRAALMSRNALAILQALPARYASDLTADERASVARYCATFLDQALLTGDWTRAYRAAVRQARRGHGPDEQPATRGRDLPGSIKPAGFRHRAVHDFAVDVLRDRAMLDGDRRHLPWLLEAIKAAYPAERDHVLAAVDAIELTDDEIRTACVALVANLVRNLPVYKDAKTACETLRSVFDEAADARWPLTLIDVLTTETALLDYLLKPLHLRSYRREPATVSWRHITPYLAHPHPTIHMLCLKLIADVGLDPAPALERLLEQARFAPQGQVGGRPHQAVDVINTGSVTLSPAQRAFLIEQRERGKDDWRYVEAIERLLSNLDAAAGLHITLRVHSPHHSEVIANARLTRPVWQTPSRAVCGFRRVRFASPSADWKTDDDEIGVAIIDTAAGQVTIRPIPLELPVRATGGYGLKRQILGLHALADGSIALAVQTPFADQRGWGSENRLYLHAPDPDTWRCVSRTDDALTPTDLGASERDTAAVCLSVLCIRVASDGQLTCAVDITPYHLDTQEYIERPLPPLVGVARVAPNIAAETRLKITERD